jgi:tuftelin-interacting protein 11
VRGQGLGREKQGIAKPVEAKLRDKKVGLGFGERSRPDPDEARPSPAAAQVHTPIGMRAGCADICRVRAHEAAASRFGW